MSTPTTIESTRYDWLRRAVRSFIQGFIGVLVLVGFPIAQDIINGVAGGGTVDIDVNVWKSILIAAVFGGGMALVSAVQNLTEDRTSIPAILKDKPSTGKNPVPDAEARP